MKLFVDKNCKSIGEALEGIDHHDIVAQAMASGECDSVRELLKKKGKVDQKLQKMFHAMTQIQRNVRGSEGEKDTLRFRFSALRVLCSASAARLALIFRLSSASCALCSSSAARVASLSALL